MGARGLEAGDGREGSRVWRLKLVVRHAGLCAALAAGGVSAASAAPAAADGVNVLAGVVATLEEGEALAGGVATLEEAGAFAGGAGTLETGESLAGGVATVEEAGAFAGRVATVWIFLYPDCPIANRTAPEIARVAGAFGPKGVRFFRVYAGADWRAEEVARHGAAYGLDFPAVIDRDLALVRGSGATVTPEAAVFDGAGARRYRGRIDNRYEDLGKARRRVTRHDLREALDALIAGRPVAVPETRAMGCYLPLAESETAAEAAKKEPGASDESVE